MGRLPPYNGKTNAPPYQLCSFTAHESVIARKSDHFQAWPYLEASSDPSHSFKVRPPHTFQPDRLPRSSQIGIHGPCP